VCGLSARIYPAPQPAALLRPERPHYVPATPSMRGGVPVGAILCDRPYRQAPRLSRPPRSPGSPAVGRHRSDRAAQVRQGGTGPTGRHRSDRAAQVRQGGTGPAWGRHGSAVGADTQVDGAAGARGRRRGGHIGPAWGRHGSAVGADTQVDGAAGARGRRRGGHIGPAWGRHGSAVGADTQVRPYGE